MLDNIRLHIHSDEEKQNEVERLNAQALQNMFKQNKRAFLRYAAGLRPLLEKANWLNYGVFYNKSGHANLVDKLSGTVVYGRSPAKEIARQTTEFLDNPIKVSLNSSRSKKVQRLDSCLVILGIGLGYHIQTLIQNTRHKYIIIYEPELEFFFGSCFFFNWEKALKLAEEKGVTLFFQVGESGEKIKSDLSELRSHFRLESFSVYQHYNDPVFLSIVDHAKYYSDQRFFEYAIEWNRGESWAKYLPLWTPPAEVPFSTELSESAQKRFTNNLQIFSDSFPEIADEFKKYKPSRWQPVETKSGEITLQHIETGALFCAENPIDAAKDIYTYFAQYPNKDGLTLRYSGTKLLPYLHYQFAKEAGNLIDQLDDEKSTLPETIKSMILFGLVNGYHLAELAQNHTIEVLLICEPEPDFFYASLFSIDFESIITDFNKRQARLYFNIGDDGSNLYVDLMHQFHAIGPYVLQDTYFYQVYSRKDFAQSIASLREQLQVVVSAGEYFDHVRYGIEHTRRVLRDGCYIQKRSDEIVYPEGFDETPVFVVGNGPSLDKELDYIKSVQDNVIIVSCGTTIKSLAKNNIRPDIHVEIEQNRSTYDWLVRADCAELLSETTLLSCNGIHPDVVALFKEVLICLKNGESSTEVAELSLGRDVFEKLEYAHPTVTNLALNAIVKLKFKNVYLFGVDLAFLSETEHHSKDSGYYDDNGKELYQYAEKNQIGIIVPGNFGGYLKTKYEFKLSKNCLETLLKQESFSCYNCSHGAFVEGSISLSSSKLILSEQKVEKENWIKSLKTDAFKTSKIALTKIHNSDILAKFDPKQIDNDLNSMLELLESLHSESITVDAFINRQKQLLVKLYENKNSLSFYLFYGSSNYALSVFSKFSKLTTDSVLLKELICFWSKFLKRVQAEYIEFSNEVDFIHSLYLSREIITFLNLNREYKVSVNLNRDNTNAGYSLLKRFQSPSLTFISEEGRNNDITDYLFFIGTEDALQNVIVSLNDISENQKVILIDNGIENYKNIQNMFPKHNVCLIFSHDPITEQLQFENVILGERPLNFNILALSLVPTVLANDVRRGVYIAKLRYSVNTTLLQIQNDTRRVIAALQLDDQYFYSFPGYSLFDSDIEQNYVDNLGSRSKPCSVILGSSELIKTTLLSIESIQKRELSYKSGLRDWPFS